MSAAAVRVLPARAFDRIANVADAYGGIGAGQFETKDGDPYCVHGMVRNADVPRAALWAVDIGVLANDHAVHAINARRWFGLRRLLRPFGACDARVPFSDWCAELGVERGS